MGSNKKLLQGSIIWVDVRDPVSGAPAGEHPAIVLNVQAEIDEGIDLRVAVCSTSFSLPLPSSWFAMPTLPQPGGHPQTGLTDACVVKATWLDIVPQQAVRKSTHRCPVTIFRQIMNWLADQKRAADARRDQNL